MKPILSIIALSVLLLVACGTSAPAETEALPPIETQVSSPTPADTTPEPEASEPYPGAVEPTKYDPNVPAPYLAPGEEGTSIPWEEAILLIQDGKVTLVRQFDNLMVVLVLKDGQTMSTYQPAMDAVLDLIDECGDLCQDIEVNPE
jgi:hypothetical protein